MEKPLKDGKKVRRGGGVVLLVLIVLLLLLASLAPVLVPFTG
jgi:hypothetical protein